MGLEHNLLLNALLFSRQRWADLARRRAAFWQNAQRDGLLLLRSSTLPDSLVNPEPEEESRMPDHRPEVLAYIEAAREALKSAENNMLSGDYRVVANRAYYAVFYAANALMATQGLQRSKHSAVRSLFSEKFVKPGKIEPAYSKDYDETMRRREASDYDMTVQVSADFARGGLEAARRVVARVEHYLSENGFLTA
ncbi:MAG: HEPN domain-containing protein [Chloroflexi bacterium]|nr:HEPN domain-containing protein [Chloroflexota bacterium]